MEQQISGVWMTRRKSRSTVYFVPSGSYLHNNNNENNRATRMNRPPSAGALFECVAHQDYDGLMHILAAEGVRVLQSQCWEGKKLEVRLTRCK